jgi:hypothetical protein
MSHPNGGSGPVFYPKHNFDAVRNFVGNQGVSFRSTAGEKITAKQSWTADRHTPTIVNRVYGQGPASPFRRDSAFVFGELGSPLDVYEHLAAAKILEGCVIKLERVRRQRWPHDLPITVLADRTLDDVSDSSPLFVVKYFVELFHSFLSLISLISSF